MIIIVGKSIALKTICPSANAAKVFRNPFPYTAPFKRKHFGRWVCFSPMSMHETVLLGGLCPYSKWFVYPVSQDDLEGCKSPFIPYT